MPRKVTPKATVRLNAYNIISDAILDALVYGYGRAHKHTDTPSRGTTVDCQHQAIMDALSEIIIWDDATE